jgi:hypothetical protein
MKEKMSFQEKQSILSLFNGVLILGIYSLYVYQKYLSVTPELINDFKFWGKAFITLVPIVIVVQIVMHILFYIANTIVTRESPPEKQDEMDKLIELKSLRISHWIFILGFFLAMGSQAIEMENWVMFVCLIASGFLSGFTGDIAKIYFYRKGV